MFNQKRPDAINGKQIDGKENNRNQGDDRGVLYVKGCRPRNSPHFRASVSQELRGALNKSRSWTSQSALTPATPAFRALARSGRTRGRSSHGLFHGSITRRRRFRQCAKIFLV